MEPEDSSPHSQEPTTCPYPEPTEIQKKAEHSAGYKQRNEFQLR
jgi:hypothetical protein